MSRVLFIIIKYPLKFLKPLKICVYLGVVIEAINPHLSIISVNLSNLIDVNSGSSICSNSQTYYKNNHEENENISHKSRTGRCKVNFSNLIEIIPRNQTIPLNKFLNIGNFNAQFVRNKSADIICSVVDNNIDICVITETFLNNYDNVIRNDITPIF